MCVSVSVIVFIRRWWVETVFFAQDYVHNEVQNVDLGFRFFAHVITTGG